MRFSTSFAAFFAFFLIKEVWPIKKLCQQVTVRSKIKANCDYSRLDEIPKNLLDKNDIEILNFTKNRLKWLPNDALISYPSLTEIIFQDNYISQIESEAFANQENLRILNLYKNRLSKIPGSIFLLPKLNILNLGKNLLKDLSINSNEISSIEILDISENLFTQIPNLISFPYLKKLNLTGNNIDNVKLEKLSSYCSLKVLDISKNPLNFNGCDCETFNRWIALKKIELIPSKINCQKCSSPIHVSNELFSNYDQCVDRMNIPKETIVAVAFRFKIGCFIGIICITFLIYVFYCDNKKNKVDAINV